MQQRAAAAAQPKNENEGVEVKKLTVTFIKLFGVLSIGY